MSFGMICGTFRAPITDEQMAEIQADPENPMNWCCGGAAMSDPGHCICWIAVYSTRRRKPIPGEMVERSSPCEDCAYRSTSAERQDDFERAHLDKIASGSSPFVCHQGMPHIAYWRHPATGMIVEGTRDEVGAINSWAPRYTRIENRQVAHKASGKPADICAGWATRHRMLTS